MENFYFLPLLSFFGLIFILGVLLPFIIGRNYQKSPPHTIFLSKIRTHFLSFSILGLAYLFFRFEIIPYLSSRLLLYTLFLTYFIWGLFLLRYFFKDFKNQKRDHQKKLQKLKYLSLPEKETEKWLKRPQ